MVIFNTFSLKVWLGFFIGWILFTAYNVYFTKKNDGAVEAQKILFPFLTTQTAIGIFGGLLCLIYNETIAASVLATGLSMISLYFLINSYLIQQKLKESN